MKMKQRSLYLSLILFMLGSLCITGCGSSGGGGGDAPLEPPIADFSGTWELHLIEHSDTYGVDEYDETAIITQDGNQLSLSIEYYDGELSGTISGNKMKISGVVKDEYGEMRANLSGTGDESGNHFSARANWTYTEPGYTGTGYTDIDAWRVSDSGSPTTGNSSNSPAENIPWQRGDMGLVSAVQEKIIIGDGRNDGVSRVYTGDRSGVNSEIHEFSFNGNQWESIGFGEFASGSSQRGFGGIPALAVGPARNDGQNRIYAGNQGTAEYEFDATLFGGNRIDTELPGTIPWSRDLTIGNARNDGTNRLYMAGSFGIYELTFTNGAWTQEPIAAVSTAIGRTLIADGRNDGIQRLYAATDLGGGLFECTWANGRWEVQNIPLERVNAIDAVCCGNGRNDGNNRIYIISHSSLFELSFENGSWVQEPVSTQINGSILAIGSGRNSSTQYVYAVNTNGLSEYVYSSSGWQLASILNSGLAINGITVGDGRGNRTTGVYATAGDNHVYEFMVP